MTDRLKKVYQWFENKWTQNYQKCEICGETDYELALPKPKEGASKDHPFKDHPFKDYPFIRLTCNNCCNTKFFDPKLLERNL